jgi:hypothetical protein
MNSRWLFAAVAGGVLLIAGCTGSSSSGVSATSGNGAAAAAAPRSLSAGSLAHGIAYGGSTDTTAQVMSTSIVYTAELTVRAADVSRAADEATQIAQAAGGYVSAESISAGTGATADVQLKIPVAEYPATLGRLASALGTEVSLQQQAQDVTEQVADVNSQVASDEAAITQLQALLSHAGSVGDLLQVQNQINVEESALESIQAQQRALSGETSYATVTMTILGPEAKPKPVVHHRYSAPGLTGGLRGGWHALTVTVSWTLAILGAVAPFLAIAALVGLGAYRARRWVLRRRAA